MIFFPPILEAYFEGHFELFVHDPRSPSPEAAFDHFLQPEGQPSFSARLGPSFGIFWLLAACSEPGARGATAPLRAEVVQEEIPKEVERFLPGVLVSDYRVEGSGDKKTIWLNIARKPSENIVLRGYSFSPRTQSKNPDDIRFDVALNNDGMLTGRIKDAQTLPLACKFKNNGPTVQIDKEGQIKKVLIGTLSEPSTIGSHEIPAGYTMTNINFDEQGRPSPDPVQSICFYNIDSKGSCAFPPDGRLSPIPLYP